MDLFLQIHFESYDQSVFSRQVCIQDRKKIAKTQNKLILETSKNKRRRKECWSRDHLKIPHLRYIFEHGRFWTWCKYSWFWSKSPETNSSHTVLVPLQGFHLEIISIRLLWIFPTQMSKKYLNTMCCNIQGRSVN